MSLANISIVGNLVRQPEQVHLPSSRVKTTFVVAVNKRPRNGEKQASDFYTVVAWGRLGEVAGEFLSLGNQVTVCGRLVLDHWTDRQGRNRVTPIVDAQQIALPSRPKESQSATPSVQPAPAAISGTLDVSQSEQEEDLPNTESNQDDTQLVEEEESAA